MTKPSVRSRARSKRGEGDGGEAFNAPLGQRPNPLRPATVRVSDVRSTLAVLHAVSLEWRAVLLKWPEVSPSRAAP